MQYKVVNEVYYVKQRVGNPMEAGGGGMGWY